jgi:hypothetical protein
LRAVTGPHPTYILLSASPEGSQTLHKDPDRLVAVNKEITDFGCKVVTQYARHFNTFKRAIIAASGESPKIADWLLERGGLEPPVSRETFAKVNLGEC